MAGYQRHDFETTSVSPGSDGEWGAFARGFSNGHSMGRAISTAVNRRNISKANEDYQKDVEAANQQDIKTQEEMDPELKKAGVSDRAAIMTKSQLENLSPEAQEYFKDYYRSQQLQGNKPEYRYDFATRQGMLDDAASRRKEAIQSSFLKHMGPEAYNEFRKNEAQANAAEYEDMRTQKKMAFRNFLNVARSGTPDGYRAILSMGQKLGIALPKGVQVDLGKGTITQMGPKGKPIVQPLSQEAVQPYLNDISMKIYDDIYADDMKQLDAAQNYRFNKETYGDRVLGVKLGNEKTRAGIAVDRAKAHYYGVSADEMQKNGDWGRGIKVGNFIDGTPGGKGGKTQGQDFNPLGKWDKSGVYTIDNVPFIAHTENGLAIPRLDGTGFYTEEESGALVDKLIAAGYEVQKINDGGQVIPVIKTMRGPVPLSYGESMLATHARVYGQPTQAIPTTSMHNYAGTGVD